MALKKTKVTALVTGLGAIGMGVAGILGGAAIANAVSSTEEAQRAYPVETNESGQSYGSNLGLSAEGSPDLVLVVGDHGEDGYVYRDELFSPAPSSPEEALAGQSDKAGAGVVLSVYLSDGKTQVDTFTIGGENARPAD